MEKPILVIDVGHGGKDQGGGTNSFYKEKDMALQISLYQFARFKELGLPVAITRDTDIYLSPTARTEIVRNSGAKYCVSNHINAYNPEARGVETIHSIHSSSKLARMLYEAIYKAVEGSAARRYFSKQGSNGLDYYFMHRLTGSVETVIIEYGFATNEIDAILIRDNWKAYAEAVVKAFCGYIGHEYKEPEKKIEKNIPEKEGEYLLGVEDSKKIEKLLSGLWYFVTSPQEKAEIHRLAEELRIASGQKTN